LKTIEPPAPRGVFRGGGKGGQTTLWLNTTLPPPLYSKIKQPKEINNFAASLLQKVFEGLIQISLLIMIITVKIHFYCPLRSPRTYGGSSVAPHSQPTDTPSGHRPTYSGHPTVLGY